MHPFVSISLIIAKVATYIKEIASCNLQLAFSIVSFIKDKKYCYTNNYYTYAKDYKTKLKIQIK